MLIFSLQYCSLCHDFGKLVRCTNVECGTEVCYERMGEGQGFPCILIHDIVATSPTFKCPKCLLRRKIPLPYQILHPPTHQLSLGPRRPLQVIHLQSPRASHYPQESFDLHFKSLFDTYSGLFSSHIITLDPMKHLKANKKAQREAREWQTAHPTSMLVVIVSAHSSPFDGGLIFEDNETSTRSDNIDKVLRAFMPGLLVEDPLPPRGALQSPLNLVGPVSSIDHDPILVLISCGAVITHPNNYNHLIHASRVRFSFTLGFADPAIIPAEVYPPVQQLIHKIWDGEVYREAVNHTLLNPSLIQRSPVLVTFHVKEEMQTMYLFSLPTRWHFRPLGLNFRCPRPDCSVYLEAQVKDQKQSPLKLKFRCINCQKQVKGSVIFEPSPCTTNHQHIRYHPRYPVDSNYFALVASKEWRELTREGAS
ncbi:hypothetical protein EUX98_g4725 [Antrodiella citrinella]|uniref:Uncharacterized protein n=1 Tax=Antrodiella citrinella TaxID=2447956 RepID=A0A4V3XII9_9APHY|nr:hypothetical protein EUX98_g4725 [Antrodiella citrinella]